MPVENSQSSGRTFQPARTRGSKVVLGRVPPKVRSEIVPHSPFCSGFRMSQSGAKLRLTSFQDLVTVSARLVTGFPLAGVRPTTYRPALAVTAVFPSPKRSYAAPRRGDTSLRRY